MGDILIAISFLLTWFIILHLQGEVIKQGRRINELERTSHVVVNNPVRITLREKGRTG